MPWLWWELLLLKVFLSILYSCIWILSFKSWDSKDNKEDSRWEQRLYRENKKALTSKKKEEKRELTSIKKY